MRHSRLAALLFVAAIGVPGLAAAQAVATVNGVAIDKKEVDEAVSVLSKNSNGKVQDTPALREQIKDNLINKQLILQEAARRGLEKQPEFVERLQNVREEMLRDALIADILKQSPVTDAKIKARYDQLAAQQAGSKEVHARQIMVASEAEANKVIADLKKGKKFEDLAKALSKDPAAKQTGGDMGWGNLSQMEPKLAEALKGLGKGQSSSQPFKSGLGWHVFKIEDIRDAKLPPLNDIKAQIARQIQQEDVAKAVGELRSKAKIQ
ncbi:peptidylprolyl isomerase [Pseudogulbenkiania sp. MAI-1]|uniref:peptidylprolyl isomerase n=1 Tax=Pseudogulbenkiania sp. MAI-1 TaxID=990370 RepID=UPI00045EB8C6|nr:peptidylprolyl isomerase [Pseudogulbenkiania sp. MAI-1]